ncbi:glycosyltransferase family 2 protein [Pseudoalteromonas sp. CAL260-MNA-CIBAN-0059]|uniref:glycosyltransferase family 2 protein n=1 Tax=Pseudoalteromonas sp. CAL260-MNA-CIBAN-0059 TaxID=3140430 RepID=UPI0033212825
MSELSEDFVIVVKNNAPNDSFDFFSGKTNIHVIDDSYGLGFGHNNNLVFNYCRNVLNMNDDDYFVVLNPDVLINSCDVKLLIDFMQFDKSSLAAINLFRDDSFSEYDCSIRKFPSFFQFISSFIGLGNSTILDKSKIINTTEVDWAAGSFLAFSSKLYSRLFGFDQGYFMYCEDIDICFRSALLGYPLMYYPQIKGIHLAKHANRSILSKHFFWHVNSVFRFILSKNGLVRSHSVLK